MKKIISIVVFCFYILTCHAQIFTSIRYYDKFDDAVKVEEHKTLITKTDSTFIVEEKGRTPKVYYIINYASYISKGDKDNIVNLTNNVYGFQKGWCVIKYEDKEKYFADKEKVFHGVYETNYLSKYWLFLVHRVVSRYQYSFYQEGEFIWIQNETPEDNRLGNNINRIIYLAN